MKRLLATLAALLLASSAHAFTVSSVQVRPGFFTAGVRVFCAGELDTTRAITCQLYVRDELRDNTNWSLGTTAFRRPGFTNAFDGILIGLESGHRYSTKVRVVASGMTLESPLQPFTTRIKTWNFVGPRVYISPTGTDAGTCTSGSPCKTLYYAVQQLTTANPSNGVSGGVVMKPGVYRLATSQATAVQIGRDYGGNAKADSMYYLTSDGTNPDSTIIDFTEEHTQSFVVRNLLGATNDSVFAFKPVATNGVAMRADSIKWVVRGWGDLYPPKESWAELRADKRQSGSLINYGQGAKGWCWNATGDSIYVKTPDGVIPSGAETWHLGLGDGLYVEGNNWYLSNFTIRGGNNYCLTFGSNVPPYSTRGSVADSLRLIGGIGGVLSNGYAPTKLVFGDSLTVRNCTFTGMRETLPYASIVGTLNHAHSIWLKWGTDHQIYNNVFTGNMSGPETWGEFFGVPNDTTIMSGIYIGSNKIYDSMTYGGNFYSGDAGYGGINMIWENNLFRSRAIGPLDPYTVGFAGHDPHQGPLWFIRNHIYGGHLKSLDLCGSQVSPTWRRLIFYHNTVVGRGPAVWAPNNSDLVISRNNIYVSHPEVGENTYASVDVQATDANTKLDFDYDMVDSTANGAGMFRWGNTTPASLAFVQRSGVEAHGKRGAYSSVDSTRTSAWPAAFSVGSGAQVDAGVVIPGINTWLFGHPRYYGTAPDIGAYEWIAPTDSLNMPLNPNNRLWRKLP